jgi:hypothetical protein
VKRSLHDLGKNAALRIDTLLTYERVRSYSTIFLVLGLVILLANTVFGDLPTTVSGQTLLPDYLAHWTGGRLLYTGAIDRLYDPHVQARIQQNAVGGHPLVSLYVAPPFIALLYAPLAALPYTLSCGVWTVISVALIVASFGLLRPMLPLLGQRYWRPTMVLVAASHPMLELVGSGQDSALSLFILVCGTRLLIAGRDVIAGALLAFGLLKPQMFILVPVVLLFRKRWSALTTWVLTALGLAGVSVALVGPAGIRSWIDLILTPEYQNIIQVDHAWKMQGISSLLASVAPSGIAKSAEYVGVGIAAAIVGAFLHNLARHRGRPELEVWSFTFLTTALISPHLAIYDLVVIIPSMLYLLDRYNTRAVRLSLLFLFLITWSMAARHVAAARLPWPLSGLVGGSWSALAIGIMGYEMRRPLPP